MSVVTYLLVFFLSRYPSLYFILRITITARLSHAARRVTRAGHTVTRAGHTVARAGHTVTRAGHAVHSREDSPLILPGSDHLDRHQRPLQEITVT